MPTESLALNSVITAGWIDNGSTGLGCVNSNDGDTTYIQTNSSLATQEYKFNAPSGSGVQSGDSITNVAITYTARCTSVRAATTSCRAVVGASATAAQNSSITTAYASFTINFPTNPSGGAWTYSDISDLRARFLAPSITLNFARITEVQSAVITYTPNTFANKAAMTAALFC